MTLIEMADQIHRIGEGWGWLVAIMALFPFAFIRPSQNGVLQPLANPRHRLGR